MPTWRFPKLQGSCRTRTRRAKKARVAFDVKANQVVPQEQVQERIIEETIDVVVPQVVEEPTEVVKHFPGEQV